MMETIKHIVFVDDESGVLQAMKRMLRSQREEWEMNFFSSGPDALEFLANNACDVIVTDMRMPGMDGVRLLTTVNEKYPHVVRIVLSGHADRDTVMRAVEPSHQYLAKPCKADTLRETISRACALRSLLTNDSLQTVVGKVTKLPSLPALYKEVREALTDLNVSVGQIGEIISQDVAMTAKMLQLVNSSYFGMPREVDSVSQAASVLGIEMIKSLVLSVGVFSQFESLDVPGFSISEYEKHSQRVGFLAKAIAARESTDRMLTANAYLAGFMHDIGKLVLIENMSDEYRDVLKRAALGEQSLYEEECSGLGASHASVGAYLLGMWGLPEEITEAIAFHHAPNDLPAPTFRALTAVHAANAIDHELSGSSSGLDMAYLEALSMTDHLDAWRELALSADGKED